MIRYNLENIDGRETWKVQTLSRNEAWSEGKKIIPIANKG